jgi:hypothetical protein
MSDYVCIAMLEDPFYKMVLSATPEHPEEWAKTRPLPMCRVP